MQEQTTCCPLTEEEQAQLEVACRLLELARELLEGVQQQWTEEELLRMAGG